jgi:hypothetical protein
MAKKEKSKKPRDQGDHLPIKKKQPCRSAFLF